MLKLDSDTNLTNNLKYIIGIDISLRKDTNDGVCTAVLLSYPQTIHMDTISTNITIIEPYIAGYLAFREVEFYVNIYHELKKKHPYLNKNHVIMTDGNGILHPKGFGLASHLGVLLDIPTIGCGKNLHQYDGLKYNRKEIRTIMDSKNLNELEIEAKDGTIHGIAIRTNIKPIYISQGHMISLEDSINITKSVLIKREPEPTRLADRLSREYLRRMRCAF